MRTQSKSVHVIGLKTRENASDRDAIGLVLHLHDWLRRWREIYLNQSERSHAKAKQFRIAFVSQSKTAVL